MSDWSKAEEAVASLLSHPIETISDWVDLAEAKLESSYGSQISAWKEALKGEYGCWCGPGNRCTDEVDAMDGCCHQHDLAYDTLHLAYDSMWTAAAFVATQSADEALVKCITDSEPPEFDIEALAYRFMLVEVFEARIAVGQELAKLKPEDSGS